MLKTIFTYSRGAAFLLAAPMFALFTTTPAEALPCDDLGAHWEGCEYGNTCEWQFTFRRPSCGTNVWNGYWSHSRYPGFQGRITITKAGSSVSISRSGGGVSCNYSGTYYKRDVHNGLPYRVRGTYSCSNGGGGIWRATIVNR